MHIYLHMSEKSSNFAAQNQKEEHMTALQLNAELYRNLGIIAENETMLAKVTKYTRTLAKKLTEDPTCMSKEEFYARVDKAEKQYERGEYSVMLPDEDLTTYLRRKGYAI